MKPQIDDVVMDILLAFWMSISVSYDVMQSKSLKVALNKFDKK